MKSQHNLANSTGHGIGSLEQIWQGFGRQMVLVVVGILAIVAAYSLWTQHSAKRQQELADLRYSLRKQVEETPDTDPVKRQEQVQALYLKALEQAGGGESAAWLHFDFARFLMEAGKYEEAIPHLETMLKVFPTKSPYRGLILLSLGRCSQGAAKWDAANTYLQEALQSDPNPQREFILSDLGAVAIQRNDPDAARKYFSDFLAEFGQSPLAPRVRAQMARLGGNG